PLRHPTTYLRVPHPLRLLRRVGSYDRKSPFFFSSSCRSGRRLPRPGRGVPSLSWFLSSAHPSCLTHSLHPYFSAYLECGGFLPLLRWHPAAPRRLRTCPHCPSDFFSVSTNIVIPTGA